MRPTPWIPSNQKIGGHKCIEHEVTGETSLVGKFGEIWKFDDKGNFKVVVTDHRTANQLAKKLNVKSRYRNGEEAVFGFTQDQFEIVADAIAIFRSQERQVQKASEFGLSTGSTPQVSSQKSTKITNSKQSPKSGRKNRKSTQKPGASSKEDQGK